VKDGFAREKGSGRGGKEREEGEFLDLAQGRNEARCVKCLDCHVIDDFLKEKIVRGAHMGATFVGGSERG